MFLANFELFWKKIQSVPCQHQYCLLTQRLHMLMHRAEFHLLYRVSQTIRKKKRDKTHLLVVFFGCQYNKTDHKCWLYDSQYDFSGIFSYNGQFEALIGNNAKSVKISYNVTIFMVLLVIDAWCDQNDVPTLLVVANTIRCGVM